PGANIGGPVLIPHTDFNRNRDKMFFFTAFEYYYQTLDTGLLGATVPTSAMLGGGFSPTALASLGPRTAGGGTSSHLKSCLTVTPTAGGCGSFWGGEVVTTPGGTAPFPNGVIPQSFLQSIDPSGQLFLGKAYPAPNANPLSQANCVNGGACDNYLNEVVF